MISANQIREMVSDYLMRSVDLDLFSRRFSDVFDNIEDNGDDEAIALSYQIESSLADLSAGYIVEDQIRLALAKCVETVFVNPEFRAPVAHRRERHETSSPYEAAEYDYEFA